MHRSAAGRPNETGWYEATSTKGKFTVLLPGAFNDFTTSGPAKDGGIFELHTVGMITDKKAKFSAMGGTGDSEHREQGGLEEFVKSFEKTGKIGNKKTVTLDGVPGMEFTVRDEDNGATFRVYLKDETIYQLIVEYPIRLEKELKPDIDRFMNSLKIPKM